MAYDPTIYRGAAAHYRTGRPPYSAELERVLVQTLALDRGGRLLDVGCGPGTLAVRLAGRFDRVVGLDPDPAMLAEAARAAVAAGRANVSLVCALAEALPEVAPGPFRLVAFGQSVHWMEERRVVEAVYDLLEPGGAIALVVHTVEGRPRPRSPGPPPIPHDEIAAIVTRYLGARRRAGTGYAPERSHRFEDVLVQTPFGAPRVLFAPGDRDVVRDAQGVLSGYFSLSWSAPHLYGDRVDDFARDVLALLARRSSSGLFWDWPGDTEIVLAVKAGG